MRSVLDIPLFKRSDETVKEMCKKDGYGALGAGFYVDGKPHSYRLYNTGTGETKYKWEKGKSRLGFKEWYSKYCPKASEDYTLFLLYVATVKHPYFHIALALIWLGVSSYINYYKLTNTVSEDEENRLAAGLIVSSVVLHFFFYRSYVPTILMTLRSFRYMTYTLIGFVFFLLPVLLLFINPITLPSIILALNLSKAENRDTYKDSMWKINTGFCAIYVITGLFMAFRALM